MVICPLPQQPAGLSRPPLSAIISRARKQSMLPPAARNHKGPELSAMEAAVRPVSSNAALSIFIYPYTSHLAAGATVAMLADPSDIIPAAEEADSRREGGTVG